MPALDIIQHTIDVPDFSKFDTETAREWTREIDTITSEYPHIQFDAGQPTIPFWQIDPIESLKPRCAIPSMPNHHYFSGQILSTLVLENEPLIATGSEDSFMASLVMQDVALVPSAQPRAARLLPTENPYVFDLSTIDTITVSKNAPSTNQA